MIYHVRARGLFVIALDEAFFVEIHFLVYTQQEGFFATMLKKTSLCETLLKLTTNLIGILQSEIEGFESLPCVSRHVFEHNKQSFLVAILHHPGFPKHALLLPQSPPRCLI